jgi:thiol:disulfide interchange protein DsbC
MRSSSNAITTALRLTAAASLTAALVLASAQAFATKPEGGQQSSVTAPTDAKSAKVLAEIIKKFPNNPAPKSVVKTQIPGVFEVLTGDQIMYVDESATYFIFGGQLVDLAKQENLTEARKSQLLTLDVATLDVKDAITRVKGNGAAKLYLWTDPHCPYCRRLEDELSKVDNATIYTFLMPRPDAKAVGQTIWCSDNAGKLWEDFMKTQAIPAEKTCPNPIERNLEFAHKNGISGTPTLFNASGKRLTGYTTADKITAFMTQGPAAVASAAAPIKKIK